MKLMLEKMASQVIYQLFKWEREYVNPYYIQWVLKSIDIGFDKYNSKINIIKHNLNISND